jgi:WD40 repeat protein
MMKAEAPSSQTTLAILLGASQWPYSPLLHSSAAFAKSFRAFNWYLLDPHLFKLPLKNVLDLFDSEYSPHEIDQMISDFLDKRITEMRKSGESARDVLIYYVGHGGFTSHDDFFLSVRCTRAKHEISSSILIASLANTLKEHARFLRRLLILDCCFAAEAVRYFQGADLAQVVELQVKNAFEVPEIGRGFPSRGTSLLCSSSRRITSRLAPNGHYTMFTEALLQALSVGDSSIMDNLSLYALQRLTEDYLRHTYQNEEEAPRPEVHSPDQHEGDVALIPFFPNPAVVKAERDLQPEVKQVHQIEEEYTYGLHEADRGEDHENMISPSNDSSSRPLSMTKPLLISQPAVVSDEKVDHVSLVRSTKGHTDKLLSLAFTQDSHILASASTDATVRLWRVSDGTSLQTLAHRDPINNIVFSPGGTLLITGGGDEVRSWRVRDGQLLYRLNQYNVQCVAFASDSQTFVSGGGTTDGTIRLRHIDDGTVLRTFYHRQPIISLAFRPDSRTLISASEDGIVRLWQIATMTILYELNLLDKGNNIVFTADGQSFISWSLNKLWLWNLGDRAPWRSHKVQADEIFSIAFAHDGQMFALATNNGTVQLWRLSEETPWCTLTGYTDAIRNMAFAPDGQLLALGTEEGEIWLWKIQ